LEDFVMSKSNGNEKQLSEKLKQIELLRQRIMDAAKPVRDDLSIGHIADMSDKYPLLCSVLTAHLERGGPAEGATILLWGKEDGLGGILNVKPLGVRAFIDANCLLEWLGEAERLLGDPNHKWAKDKPKGRPKQSYGHSKGRT
jgi:hypothetical protein